MIPVGEWLPDFPDLAGSPEALNVIPDEKSYRPFPSLGVYSAALGARARGFVGCKDAAGNAYDFVGTAGNLYQLSNTSWTDVTRGAGAYSTASTDWWEFAQWGNHIIAVNGTDDTQTISLGAASFSALGGSPPIARHIAVVRDFVVVGNTSAETRRVQWSGINDHQVWTGSSTNLADSQDLVGESGHVQKVTGGEFGLVFQERAITRMTFAGLPYIFQFDKIDNSRGAMAPQAVVQVGNVVFFLAEDGFYMTGGAGESTPIGQGKIDRFFLGDLDSANLHRVQGVADPQNRIVIWCYPSTGSAGEPDSAVIYNWAVNKWARAEISVDMLCRFLTPGYTLDGLDSVSTDLDALPASLDDPAWMGGRVNFAAFDSSHRLSTFSGVAMNATVDTIEVEPNPGIRSSCISVMPVVDGGTDIRISVGQRNIQTETRSFYGPVSANSSGFCPVRVNSRYQVYRISTSASFSHILGARPTILPEGPR